MVTTKLLFKVKLKVESSRCPAFFFTVYKHFKGSLLPLAPLGELCYGIARYYESSGPMQEDARLVRVTKKNMRLKFSLCRLEFKL